MRRPATRPLALSWTVAAIAIAGCGGSSSKPSGGTSGRASTGLPSKLLPSTKVSSSTYRSFAERGLARIPGVPAGAIPKIVNCVIQKELAQGIITLADVKTHQSEARADGVACAHAAGLH